MSHTLVLEKLFGKDSVCSEDDFHLPHVKNYIASIKELCEQTKDIALKYCIKNPPHIEIVFINSLKFNAEVKKHESTYYIGLNIGVILLINDLFGKIMATRSILNDLGDASLESSVKRTLSVDALEYDVTFKKAEEDEKFIGPKCNKRWQYVPLFNRSVIQFLILHECGHILKGHIDTFKKGRKLMRGIDINIEEIDGINLHTLEMDADSLAANASFNLLTVLTKPESNWADLDPPANNLKQGMYLWCFAIYSMFRLFRFEKREVKDHLRKSHPPPAMRMELIMSIIHTLLSNKYDKEFVIEVLNYAEDGAKEADNAFVAVTYAEPETALFFTTHLDDKMLEYYKAICLNWNNIRPLLEPNAYMRLPIPTVWVGR